jgi:hypothetical protein
MKKNQRIGMIKIENVHISAYDTDGVEVKLTRRQRIIFSHFKTSNFLKDVEKEFGANPKYILDKSFFIQKDGDVVFTM